MLGKRWKNYTGSSLSLKQIEERANNNRVGSTGDEVMEEGLNY